MEHEQSSTSGNSQNFTFALQYLEPGPHVDALDPQQVREKLRSTFSILPISIVIIGWDIPQELVEICRAVTHEHGAQFYRWQPLLTSAGSIPVHEEFRMIGLGGQPLPAFKAMPSFTFMCPKHPAFSAKVLGYIDEVARSGTYDGIFLDRMRYPALTRDMEASFGCFCPACQREAERSELDLSMVQENLLELLTTRRGRERFLAALLQPKTDQTENSSVSGLNQFLDFRVRTINKIVKNAAHIAKNHGLQVGLDCFSPSVSFSVGQDMQALNSVGDWIKPMTYLHTFAPAGLPFELYEMMAFLAGQGMTSEAEETQFISELTGLRMPNCAGELLRSGLEPHALEVEIAKAKAAGVNPMYAGIELVALEGVTWIDEERLEQDMQQLKHSGVDGMVLSWDLLHFKRKHLRIVRAILRKSPHQLS